MRKGENAEEDAGENDLPETLSEEYIQEISAKLDVYIDRLEKCGDQEPADMLREMHNVYKKLKLDLNASEAKIVAINEEREADRERLEEAFQMSRKDQEVITRLRVNIQNAWKKTDMAHERELASQAELANVKSKLENYEQAARKAALKKSAATEELEKNLIPLKEDIIKERDNLVADVRELNRKLQIQRAYIIEMEGICSSLEEKNKSLYKFLDAASIETLKEKKLVESITKELNDAKEIVKEAEDNQKHLKEQNEKYIKYNVQLNMQILASKSRLADTKTKLLNASAKLAKISAELDTAHDQKDKIQVELNQKIHALRLKEDEIAKLKADSTKLSRSNDLLLKKLVACEQAKSKVNGEIIRMKSQCNVQEKEFLVVKKSIDNYIKRINELVHERDYSKRTLAQAEKQTLLTKEKLNMAEKEIDSLKNDIETLTLNDKNYRQERGKVIKEVKQLSDQIEVIEEKNDSFINQLHLKEGFIAELKKNVNEANKKIANAQNQVETLNGEKTNLYKSLAVIVKEKDNIKEDLSSAYRTIAELKEKIDSKDVEINKLEIQSDKLDKDRCRLRIEVDNCRVILQNTRSELKEKKMEIENLYQSLADSDYQLKKFKKDFDELQHSKGLLGGQLKTKNDEIEKLNQKLIVVQTDLDRGNSQLSEKVEDIRLLKIEIQNLRSEQIILRKDREFAARSRRELLRLHRLLNQERVKARALQDEMLTPMNVHRWRALAGRDPEKFDLISKVQNLRKQILSQNVLAIDRENALKEAHFLYKTLKEFVVKLPSYKVREQLNDVKHVLGVKEKKMKALVAELNAKEVDDKTKDCILEDLRSNLESTKKELTRERKKKQKLLQERHILAHMQMQYFPGSVAYLKTAGAGYKMSLSS